MCKVLRVSRSGYYHWLGRKPSKREQEQVLLVEEIKRIHRKSKQRYGSPKITRELNENGFISSRPRVARIMQKEGIRSITHKKFKVQTTDSKHDYPVAENILNRVFTAKRPGQKWISDITYIPTSSGWVYLTVIIDLYDRKVIGWSISTNMTAKDTVIAAWNMALINRKVYKGQGLIFHSDRGVQYACGQFTNRLISLNVIQSMSRKGNCWDNAVAENFFRMLKAEMVNHQKFQSILDLRMPLFEYIEIWYNRKRKHATLDYRTPEQIEKEYLLKCA